MFLKELKIEIFLLIFPLSFLYLLNFFIYLKKKKAVRVDQLKFNKSCTSFIGDLKSVKIPKLSQSIPHLTQKIQKFVIIKEERKYILRV